MRYADVHPAFREAAYELSFLADSLLRAVADFPVEATNLLKPLVEPRGRAAAANSAAPSWHGVPSTVRDAFREAYERVCKRALVEIEGGAPGPYWIIADNPWGLSEAALRIVDQHCDFWPGDLFCRRFSLMKSRQPAPALLADRWDPMPEVQPTDTLQWVAGRLDSLARIFADVATWASSDFLGFFGCGSGDRPSLGKVDVNFPQHASLKNVPKIVALSRRLCCAVPPSHRVVAFRAQRRRAFRLP